MVNLEDIYKNLSAVNNLSGLGSYITELTKELDLKHFAFVFNAKFDTPPDCLHNFPKELEHIYKNESYPHYYYNYEPSHIFAEQKSYAFDWKDPDYEPVWDSVLEKVSRNSLALKLFQQGMEITTDCNINLGVTHSAHYFLREKTFFVLVCNDSITNDDLTELKNKMPIIHSMIGQHYLCLERDLRVISLLTRRESECLIWTARGKTVWETAKILKVSQDTVKTHLKNIFRKLDVTSKTQAVARAIALQEIAVSDIL